VKAEKGISVTVTQESEISEAAAKAPVPPGAPGAVAVPQAAARLEAQDDSEAAAPPPVADLAYAEAEVVAETTATPPPAVSHLTTADKPSGPALVAQERSGGSSRPEPIHTLADSGRRDRDNCIDVPRDVAPEAPDKAAALPRSGSSHIPIRCPARRLSHPFCLMKIRPFINSFHRPRFYPELVVCWPGIFLDDGLS